MKENGKQVIVALDVSDKNKAAQLFEELGEDAGALKIGLEMFIRFGPGIVKDAVTRGANIMLDLKLHDIPNTVQRAVANVSLLGAKLLTIHTTGGKEMMKAARRGIEDAKKNAGVVGPKLLGVTVLTSISEEAMGNELGVTKSVEEQVVSLALLAKEAGLDGVVASPKEIKSIRKVCGDDFLIVTPGIRPAGSSADDQKRICTPEQAVADGADYLVIGRPILQAENPVDKLKEINESIS
jgi:orotidine-5'-phosphate decarboxylase